MRNLRPVPGWIYTTGPDVNTEYIRNILHGADRKSTRIISDPLTMGSYLRFMATDANAISKITNKAFRRSLFSI